MTTYIENNKIDGLDVISALDVTTLEAGQHKFWFRISTDAVSQHQHLPVWVFKGSKLGKNIVITAGVHGDEYNGVLAAQQIARELKDKDIAGCVTIVPTVNLTGMKHHTRDFVSSDPDVSNGNLNRFFPGDATGNDIQRYIYALWHHLLQPNAELAIDLHTQTSGTVYPLYTFADFRIDDAVQMARLMNPDAILNDPGDPGILETVWNENGIPSITVEVGMGRYTDVELVQRTTRGVMNIFKHHGMIEGETMTFVPAVEGEKVTSIRAEQGGFILPQAELMQFVEEGQLLAIQYDSFGEEIHQYRAPESGILLSQNIESMRAAGSLVARIIHPYS
ncbi:succinylglutamate desuccinylase/aspartoacylase family protein [Enterovibrio baiacu]|uniref:succinylglutamate desuccinylase/aspartoacylase family protein n=1 Tax=Enterovibrio baiacu TaxID=2491023 RepID=UPI003D0C5D3C